MTTCMMSDDADGDLSQKLQTGMRVVDVDEPISKMPDIYHTHKSDWTFHLGSQLRRKKKLNYSTLKSTTPEYFELAYLNDVINLR